ncbi:MAG: CehA/McbA family metallohydrolase [Planctomycetaceae bacterium]|nr:CehA/McbA family metallohydrolase [Planctomycetaceae bacterium]
MLQIFRAHSFGNILVLALVIASTSILSAGTLKLTVRNEAKELVPFRIHLKDAKGEVVKHAKLPFHFDHFTSPGELSYELPAGQYSYEIEKGPEFEQVSGMVTLPETGTKTVDVVIERLTKMSDRHWYSGDLHIHRPVEDVPLLVEAEDLNIAPVITWWNQRNVWRDREIPATPTRRLDPDSDLHWLDVMAGEDERNGGALLYFHLVKPLGIGAVTREFPSSIAYLHKALKQEPGVHIDVEKPFWWDVPAWVTTGEIDTIGIANNHMCRSGMYESEAWGFPRDTEKLPPPTGNGQWSQQIYYHLLNSGFRIPPSAGSASGVLPNPVGYNRVYVHVEGELTWEKWWDGLRAGRSFVTNGPLFDLTANDQLPGYVFKSEESIPITIKGNLISRDPLEMIEVVHNGNVVMQIAPREDSEVIPESTYVFSKSGWFLIRVRTENPRTFRFASTAPYYLEIGDTPQFVSQESVTFFQDWLNQRIDQIHEHVKNEKQLKAILPPFEAAREFWQKKL